MADSKDMRENVDNMSKSIVHKLMDQHLAKQAENTKAFELTQDFIKATNGMASTPNGEFFLKQLIKYCGVHKAGSSTNAQQLIEDNGKRKVYVELIRPCLDKTILINLET